MDTVLGTTSRITGGYGGYIGARRGVRCVLSDAVGTDYPVTGTDLRTDDLTDSPCECLVCAPLPHDTAVHDATVSVHRWFRETVVMAGRWERKAS